MRPSKRRRRPWTTHESLSFILIFGRLCAIFPLKGLSDRNFQSLKFEWSSGWTVYGIAVAAASLVLVVFQIIHIADGSSAFHEFGKTQKIIL